ncbi:terpenoid cyclases/protein prenyltransferase alpha-alpha toroid [Aspergillus unguis]
MASAYSLTITERLNPQSHLDNKNDSSLSAKETSPEGWRLTVEEPLGRLKWIYLRTEEERRAHPQDNASKFYLGLEVTGGQGTETRAKTPSEAVLAGARYHSQVQVNGLGCWAADVSCIFFVTPMLIIAWYITGARIPEAHCIELVRFIRHAQNDDGGWPTYCGKDTTLMGTILIYVALRLLGLSADEPELIQARACLLNLGGAVQLPSWAKFWLALLGLYKWEGTDPYPVEMWLLPEWVPVSPWKWFVIPRQVYLPMSYLSAKQFTMPTNPLLDEIRKEIFVQDYDSVDFVAFRGTTLKLSRELSIPWPMVIVNWILLYIWIPFFRSNALFNKAVDQVWEIIKQADKETNSVGVISVDNFLNMISVYSEEGPDSKRLRRIHDASREYLWMAPRGMQMMSVHAGSTWETGLTMQGYAEAGPGVINAPEIQPAVRGAYKFLVDQQHTTDFAKDSPCLLSSRLGGWPFGTKYQGLVCSDCTGEAMKAVLLMDKKGGFPRLTTDKNLQLGVDNLIMNQNPSGGYASFEPIRGSPLLEYVNGTQLFGKVMVEYDYTECTSSCITALALYRQQNPSYRTVAVKRAIDRGIEFLLRQQRRNGSWIADWGIACTYGAFFAMDALAAAGIDYSKSEQVRRGCRFIAKQQQSDGGWGESMQSIIQGRYVQSDISHTVQTAWACLALMLGGYPDREPITKGMKLIMSRQRASGEWPQEEAVGCGIVTCELLYHSYIYGFPIRALAMYRDRYGDEPLLE